MLEVKSKSVVDVCCGGKSFYFDKNDSRVLFCDKRSENLELHFNNGKIKRVINVNPDVVCDFTNLPFKNESFNLVIFDPPHMRHVGESSLMFRVYGKLPKEYKPFLQKGFNECFRILKRGGTLVFKWAETNYKLNDILELAEQKPLFAQRSSKTSFFVVFYKE